MRVADVIVQPLSARLLKSTLEHYLADGRPHHIVTANVDFLRRAANSTEFRQIVNGADLVSMDGMPLVWLAGRLGIRCNRITGSDVILALCHLGIEHKYRIFLLGGAAGVAYDAGRWLIGSYPGLLISGTFSPPHADYPFPPEMEIEITERIRAANPDILVVAFGSPKQELWIHEHLETLDVPISVGVGACLDFFAGRVGRAPERLQGLGVEWLYRLWREPRRLWRRYLLDDLPFFIRLLTTHLLASCGRARPVIEIVG
jgi:exopolysaccharide biosynthesis WecB/TagA/CpsF family protein